MTRSTLAAAAADLIFGPEYEIDQRLTHTSDSIMVDGKRHHVLIVMRVVIARRPRFGTETIRRRYTRIHCVPGFPIPNRAPLERYDVNTADPAAALAAFKTYIQQAIA